MTFNRITIWGVNFSWFSLARKSLESWNFWEIHVSVWKFWAVSGILLFFINSD